MLAFCIPKNDLYILVGAVHTFSRVPILETPLAPPWSSLGQCTPLMQQMEARLDEKLATWFFQTSIGVKWRQVVRFVYSTILLTAEWLVLIGEGLRHAKLPLELKQMLLVFKLNWFPLSLDSTF